MAEFLVSLVSQVVVKGFCGSDEVIPAYPHFFDVISRIIIVTLDNINYVDSQILRGYDSLSHPDCYVGVAGGWRLCDVDRVLRLNCETDYLLLAEVKELRPVAAIYC